MKVKVLYESGENKIVQVDNDDTTTSFYELPPKPGCNLVVHVIQALINIKEKASAR